MKEVKPHSPSPTLSPPPEKKDRGETIQRVGSREELQKTIRNLLGVMTMFITLIMVEFHDFIRLNTYIQYIKVYILNMHSLLYVNLLNKGRN